ncbi:MAG: quinolinate synthase NadA [Acidobacteriaceae bacterium]|nr:quinolinate synthase NadA [Acidobacteriaceae bacterium]
MVSDLTLAEEIQALKAQRRAVILAHRYQDIEIQDLADEVGDSFELARMAQRYNADVIAVCGVRFIGETVKILNPRSQVVIPDGNAGCSLAESCSAAAIRAFRSRHPEYVIVSYMHTSAEVKAESDLLCTSRNAVAVVRSIPAEKPILFVPDSNLGHYVQKQTLRRNMKIWQGACLLHATFSARRLAALHAQHPGALVAAHPECPSEILRLAHFVGAPSSIVDWCAAQTARSFILVTESGLRYSLEQRAPGKNFYFVANEHCHCSECPYMKLNSLEKLAACLERMEPCIDLPPDLLRRARVPLERMLALQ